MLQTVVIRNFGKNYIRQEHYMSTLADPDPPKLARRTGLGEFGPTGWGWQARTGPAAELNTSSIYCCLLF